MIDVSPTARAFALDVIALHAGEIAPDRVLGLSRSPELLAVRVDVAAFLRSRGWSCTLIAALFQRHIGAVAHWLRLAQAKQREPICRALGLTPWKRTRATDKARKQQKAEAHAQGVTQ